MSVLEWRREASRVVVDVLVLRPDPPHDLTAVPVRALLDTGATTSGVTRAVAQQLGLQSVGKRPVGTAGGVIIVDRYLFRIGLPIDGPLPFIFDELAGFELLESANYGAVLGMDVLRRCDFEMRRDGCCRLSFG